MRHHCSPRPAAAARHFCPSPGSAGHTQGNMGLAATAPPRSPSRGSGLSPPGLGTCLAPASGCRLRDGAGAAGWAGTKVSGAEPQLPGGVVLGGGLRQHPSSLGPQHLPPGPSPQLSYTTSTIVPLNHPQISPQHLSKKLSPKPRSPAHPLVKATFPVSPHHIPF